MSLMAQLKQWDGKSADAIGSIYRSACDTAGFEDELISLLQREDCQSGASWCLKAWLEQNHSADQAQSDAILGSLPQLEDWQSKLHVLQCLPYLKVSAKTKSTVENFLRQHLSAENKFVRAWCYNGWFELACDYPEYHQQVQQFFDMAMRDEAASVKARIRKLQKKGFSS
ncbi:MAG: hypothetical protein MRY76_13050 [Pseudomonadales bacterium]|nr:hypothetical protein [Pseudomonadales bacterium]